MTEFKHEAYFNSLVKLSEAAKEFVQAVDEPYFGMTCSKREPAHGSECPIVMQRLEPCTTGTQSDHRLSSGKTRSRKKGIRDRKGTSRMTEMQ